MLPRRRLSWHPAASTPSETTAAETVLDSLGTDALQEISVDTLKWRFFEMGIRVGVAVQMLFMCLLLILSENEAIVELSMLYYPLFRGVFLLSFFGVLFALMLFAWKRTGIDYGMIFDVSPHRTNYHAVVRAASTLMSLNFVAFVAYWLTLTVHLTRMKDLWPFAAFAGTILLLVYPNDWMPEWKDATQRLALARTIGRALSAPFASPSFAASFVADVFTSMPKCFIDLLFATCIYASGEAFAVGAWRHTNHTFEHELTVCTPSDPTYKIANSLLTVLPFVIRLLQCARQIYDATKGGKTGDGWRQPAANALKYCTSLLVQLISLFGGRNNTTTYHAWLTASIVSTLFAFSWDVLIDWGLGPQPLRRAVRRILTPSAPKGGEYTGASYWLRVVRVFPDSWYVAGILADFVARLGWAVYISPGQQVVANHTTLLLGTVELIRRAIWALFRLEWEQILRVARHEDQVERQSRRLEALEEADEAEAEAATLPSSGGNLLSPLLTVSGSSKDERIVSALRGNVQRMKSNVWELSLIHI